MVAVAIVKRHSRIARFGVCRCNSWPCNGSCISLSQLAPMCIAKWSSSGMCLRSGCKCSYLLQSQLSCLRARLPATAVPGLSRCCRFCLSWMTD